MRDFLQFKGSMAQVSNGKYAYKGVGYYLQCPQRRISRIGRKRFKPSTPPGYNPIHRPPPHRGRRGGNNFNRIQKSSAVHLELTRAVNDVNNNQ